MFLIGCNPLYENARNLVIACFALLGSNEKKTFTVQNQIYQQIQNTATNGAQKHVVEDTMKSIEQFLVVQASNDKKKRFFALQGIKDLILFNKKVCA